MALQQQAKIESKMGKKQLLSSCTEQAMSCSLSTVMQDISTNLMLAAEQWETSFCPAMKNSPKQCSNSQYFVNSKSFHAIGCRGRISSSLFQCMRGNLYRQILHELCHHQPRKSIQTDNSTANGVINKKCNQNV